MLIAITATAIGFAFDAGSGSKELGMVFAGAYIVGCLAAVLAVRQAGLFTAVVQPPLLLFVAVPTAYFLFHGGRFTGIRDTLINFGYPLIERFPLMFFTSAAVLLTGMVRWHYGASGRRGAPKQATTKDAGGLMSAVSAKLSSLVSRNPDEEDAEPRRKRTADRPSRSTRTAPAAGRSGKPARRSAPSRSRHTRPPETEIIESVRDRPRRSRNPRQAEPPPEPRRRSRSSSSTRRSTPPPTERRSPYERPERRRRFDDYQPLEPHGTNGNGGTNGAGTHHPVSRVRYRGADDFDRPRPRTPRLREPEGWQYDI